MLLLQVSKTTSILASIYVLPVNKNLSSFYNIWAGVKKCIQDLWLAGFSGNKCMWHHWVGQRRETSAGWVWSQASNWILVPLLLAWSNVWWVYCGLFVCFDNVCVQREETEAFRDLGSGNRIATWLTYVSTCQIC